MFRRIFGVVQTVYLTWAIFRYFCIKPCSTIPGQAIPWRALKRLSLHQRRALMTISHEKDMKTLIQIFYIAVLAALITTPARADSVPELLHYKFSGTGASVPNLASAPPSGTATATIMGGLAQTGTDLNTAGDGNSLVGSGLTSSTDYLNTGWATSLTGSWTISFVTSNIGPSGTLYYIFGDANAALFRCFTNGVAGPSNWILRGPLTDVLIPGGATVATHRTTFVYDSVAGNIRGYLDGTLVATVAQAPLTISGSGPFKVVGYATNVGAPAGGLLDDFRVYNRALSAVEVANIDTGPTAVSSAPVGSPAASATSMNFIVTFSEAVSGVTAGDFILTATGSAVGTVGTPSTADGIAWTVPVSGIAGTGTLRLDLNATGTGIVAVAAGSTPLFAGFTGGSVHNVAVAAVPPAASIAAVPTLSEGALVLLAGLMALFGLGRTRRRSQ